MILADSDVFLIDLRYQRDQRFGSNRAFLDRLATSGQGATTIYNLLEVCGVLSFNLNRQQLRELYSHFARRFHVRAYCRPRNLASTCLRSESATSFRLLNAGSRSGMRWYSHCWKLGRRKIRRS